MSKISFYFISAIFLLSTSATWAADTIPLKNWKYRVLSDLSQTQSTPWKAMPAEGVKLKREEQGFIDYEMEFTAPTTLAAYEQLGVYLGHIGDVDEAYINGQLIGKTGGFPPYYKNEMDIIREYLIPNNFIKLGQTNTLRVLTYVEYIVLKGVKPGDVELGQHSVLQEKKYLGDLWWYFLRALIPLLCLALATISLPWFAPKGLRLQQMLIFALAVDYCIFGTCRSRIVFHLLDNFTAYKITTITAIFGMGLIFAFTLCLSKVRRAPPYIIGFIPAIVFCPTILLQTNLIDASIVVKHWFSLEAIMMWGCVFIWWKYNSRKWLKYAFLFLAVLVTNDILRDLRIIGTPPLMDIGFSILMICIIFSQLLQLRLSWERLAKREGDLAAEIKLGQIAGHVSHDIRKFVATIAMMIDKTNLPTETKNKITTQIGRIHEITGKHLSQVKAVAKNSMPTVQPKTAKAKVIRENRGPTCSLGGAVQTCVEEAKLNGAFKNISFNCEIPKEAMHTFVPMSFTNFTRVVTNLLINAIQATVGNKKDTIAIFVTFTDRRNANIIIKDQGAGFDPEVKNAILEGKMRTTKPSGHGIGLLASIELLQNAGGDINIMSSSNGTAIRLGIPTVRPPSWFFNILSSPSKKIICLDDDTSVESRVKKMFPEREVFFTTSDKEFVQQANANPEALLLVDFDYGVFKNGIELINENNYFARAVLVSGKISFDDDLIKRATSNQIKMYPKECLLT